VGGRVNSSDLTQSGVETKIHASLRLLESTSSRLTRSVGNVQCILFTGHETFRFEHEYSADFSTELADCFTKFRLL
jgi:hypothetical protein